TNIAEHNRYMLHGFPRQFVGIGMSSACTGLDRRVANALDQRFLTLAIGDEVGNCNPMQRVLFSKSLYVRTAHDGTVIIDQLANNADGRQIRELAEVDSGFRMAGAH